MSNYAGLDVSDKTKNVCVVDADGVVLKRDVVASDPEVLAKWLGKHCPGLVRVLLETGPLSTFLHHDVPSLLNASAPAMPRVCCRRGSTRAMFTMRRGWRSSLAPAGSSVFI